ncbi:MAG: helix-turn-helix domain-containing protein [Limnohabitans sp.]
MNEDHNPQPRKTLRPGNQLHQRRWLEQANQTSLELNGLQEQPSKDPHGQILRQLRQSQHRSPSDIATLACISLGQLYELETGGNRLFYSDALRQQAARRVAQLLNSRWEDIVGGKITALHLVPPLPAQSESMAQVISLQTGLPVSAPVAERAQPPRPQVTDNAFPPSGVALLATPTADQTQAPADTSGDRDSKTATTGSSQPRPRASGVLITLTAVLILCVVVISVAHQSGHLEALGLKF